MTRFALIAVALSACLSGCATVLSDGFDRVTITTGDVSESKIFVDGLLVGWEKVQVKLERGRTHVIRVERDGCLAQEVVTGQELDPATWGGVSLLGMGVATDVALGTAWKVDRDQYEVKPDCSALAMNKLDGPNIDY